MKVVTPETHKREKLPELFPDSIMAVFLGGSIEMGAAEDWQSEAIKELQEVEKFLHDEGVFSKHLELLVMNPRRENWDSSWVQSKDNPQFREQVEWELHCQQAADYILYYFSPETKSPITLLELGLFGANPDVTSATTVVVCPDGFWRKGNVDIVCDWYSIDQVDSIKDFGNLICANESCE